MTEYTTDPDAIRHYVSSRDRTARWVTAHYDKGGEFDSPSMPVNDLPLVIPSSPSSEAESNHSTSPRIILRYSDGRPDVAVPSPDAYNLARAATSSRRHGHEGSRDHSYPYDRRPRTGSHGAFSPNAFGRRTELSPAVAPEQIRILPSHSGGTSHYSRSKSLSREASSSDPSSTTLSSPTSQSPEPIIHSKPIVVSPPSHNSHASHYSHSAHNHHHDYYTTKVSHGPRPAKHTQPPVIHPPPHTSRSHYQPPYYSHPPQVGPNGVVYSHSAPVPLTQPAHVHPVPFPTPHHYGPHHPKHGRSRFEDPPRSQSASGFRRRDGTVDAANDGAYYVFPTPGQKIHVITPSPEQAARTAPIKSSTFSGTHNKKPFFQRLFGFATDKFSSSNHVKASSSATLGSETGGRKIRRHSTTGARRPITPGVDGH